MSATVKIFEITTYKKSTIFSPKIQKLLDVNLQRINNLSNFECVLEQFDQTNTDVYFQIKKEKHLLEIEKKILNIRCSWFHSRVMNTFLRPVYKQRLEKYSMVDPIFYRDLTMNRYKLVEINKTIYSLWDLFFYFVHSLSKKYSIQTLLDEESNEILEEAGPLRENIRFKNIREIIKYAVNNGFEQKYLKLYWVVDAMYNLLEGEKTYDHPDIIYDTFANVFVDVTFKNKYLEKYLYTYAMYKSLSKNTKKQFENDVDTNTLLTSLIVLVMADKLCIKTLKKLLKRIEELFDTEPLSRLYFY